MKKTRFTLIELLVVIAIIAILMTILLPALRRARETAKITLCRNNVKQNYLGIFNYQDDWNGFFPLYRNPNTYENRRAYWMATISPYVDGPPYDGVNEYGPTKSESEVQFCPTLTRHPGDGTPINGSSRCNRSGYGINNRNVVQNTSIIHNSSRKLKPSTAIFGDSDGFGGAWWPSLLDWEDNFLFSARSCVSIRHRGKGNIAFWDGCVKNSDNATTYRWYGGAGSQERRAMLDFWGF